MYYEFTTGAVTHHIEVDQISLVSGALVQRAVLPSDVLPGAVKVVGHHVEVVQDAAWWKDSSGQCLLMQFVCRYLDPCMCLVLDVC